MNGVSRPPHGLPALLAPPPRAVTPERLALAAVGAITAVAAPPALAHLEPVQRIVGDSAVARLSVTLVAAALAVALAGRAMRAPTTMQARVWLVAGGAGSGALAAVLGYVAAVIGGGSRIPYQQELHLVLLGAFLFGAPLGAAFGIVYAPAVVAASIARRKPSHDALDRVAFGAGVVLAAVSAVAARLSTASLAAVSAAGAALAITAAARLVMRARFVEQARAGALPGFTITPRTDREDEDALLPLVRTRRPAGVLVAAGVEAPYRGERGAMRIALIPTPEQPYTRPIRRLITAAVGEIGAAVLAIHGAALGLVLVGFTVGLLLAAFGAVGR